MTTTIYGPEALSTLSLSPRRGVAYVFASDAPYKPAVSDTANGIWVCDGADDQVQLNLASAAAGEVKLSSGVFNCKGITPASGVAWKGNSPGTSYGKYGATVIKLSADSDALFDLDCQGNSFSNITFSGENGSTGTARTGSLLFQYFASKGHFIFNDCTFVYAEQVENMYKTWHVRHNNSCFWNCGKLGTTAITEYSSDEWETLDLWYTDCTWEPCLGAPFQFKSTGAGRHYQGVHVTNPKFESTTRVPFCIIDTNAVLEEFNVIGGVFQLAYVDGVFVNNGEMLTCSIVHNSFNTPGQATILTPKGLVVGGLLVGCKIEDNHFKASSAFVVPKSFVHLGVGSTSNRVVGNDSYTTMPSARAASHAYLVDDIVYHSHAHRFYRCTVAGTSAAAITVLFHKATGETFKDGTVTWEVLGIYPIPTVLDESGVINNEIDNLPLGTDLRVDERVNRQTGVNLLTNSAAEYGTTGLLTSGVTLTAVPYSIGGSQRSFLASPTASWAYYGWAIRDYAQFAGKWVSASGWLQIDNTVAAVDSTATLGADCNDVVTSLTLTGAHGTKLSVGTIIKIGASAEEMAITANAADVLTVIRAVNGTTATTHTSGEAIYIKPETTVTIGISEGPNGTIITSQTIPNDNLPHLVSVEKLIGSTPDKLYLLVYVNYSGVSKVKGYVYGTKFQLQEGRINDLGSWVPSSKDGTLPFVTGLESGLSGTNPKPTIWENLNGAVTTIDHARVIVTTGSTGAATADVAIVAPTVINTCETAWTVPDTYEVTATADADHRYGTYAAKLVIASGFIARGADTLIAYQDRASVDLSNHVAAAFYIKVANDIAAGDLEAIISESAACATADQVLSIPALKANIWYRVIIPYTTIPTAADRNAVISCGIRYHANLQATTIWLDKIDSYGKSDTMLDGINLQTVGTFDSNNSTDRGTNGLGYPQSCAGWSAIVVTPSADTTGLVGSLQVNAY